MTAHPEPSPAEQRFKEYEDHHYHDEVETVPADETSGEAPPRPAFRKKPPARKFPKRRYYEED
jgi:hypothetical protein